MYAQVAVREDATTVHLAKGPTTVAVSIKNSSSFPVDAVLTLEWLPPEGKPDLTVQRPIILNPGESKSEVPLPLPATGNPLTERLRYKVAPGEKNYTAFAPAFYPRDRNSSL